MIDTFTVSFFGHRVIENPLAVERRLEMLICELLTSHGYVEFLVGRDGDFDQLVSSVIRRCKRTVRADNSSHVWVMPYETAEFRNNEPSFREYYDEIEICSNSASAHYKRAYQIRNREMADRSNLIIFCVSRKSGGAWQTMQYVRKQDIPYRNISDSDLR